MMIKHDPSGLRTEINLETVLGFDLKTREILEQHSKKVVLKLTKSINAAFRLK